MKLTALRMISEKREKDFNKLGVFDAEDLIRFYPRAYLDLTERSSLREAYHNDMVLVACEVVQIAPVNYMSRRKYVKAYRNQNGLPFSVIWFNQPYIRDRLKPGEYLFYGRVNNKYGQISLVNPSFEPLDKNYRLKGIVPVYSLKSALSQKIGSRRGERSVAESAYRQRYSRSDFGKIWPASACEVLFRYS